MIKQFYSKGTLTTKDKNTTLFVDATYVSEVVVPSIIKDIDSSVVVIVAGLVTPAKLMNF